MKCTGFPSIDKKRYIMEGIRDIAFQPCNESANLSINDIYFCDKCSEEYEEIRKWMLEILKRKKGILGRLIKSKEENEVANTFFNVLSNICPQNKTYNS